MLKAETEEAEGPAHDGLENLRELQAQLAGASQSPWQPRCVAEAFRSGALEHPFCFTLQVWIDLDATFSPFLMSRQPDPDLEQESIIECYQDAFVAFGQLEKHAEEFEPEALVFIGQSMIRAIKGGFSMRLKMNPPKGFESNAGADDGMGDWLPVFACLKAQLGFSRTEALGMPVGAALALINAHRRNEGWTPAETPYALRAESQKDEG